MRLKSKPVSADISKCLAAVALVVLLLSVVHVSSAGAGSITPHKLRGEIRSAVTTSVLGTKEGRGFRQFFRLLRVDKASITRRGAVAKLIDLPPLRDARPARFYHFARKGQMQDWTYFNNGCPRCDNFFERSRPIDRSSYQRVMARIAKRISKRSRYPDRLFGVPTRIVVVARRSASVFFARPVDPSVRAGVKSIRVNRTGQLSLIQIYPRKALKPGTR